MHQWVFRSERHRTDVPPISTGIKFNCPYCLARKREMPGIGQKVMFLSDSQIGHTGIRLDDSSLGPCIDQFTVRMNYESKFRDRTVNRHIDLYIIEPFNLPPNWAPPLSLEDTLAIHEAMLRVIDLRCIEKIKLSDSIFPVVSACWFTRSPVSGKDIWPIMIAHGFEAAEQNEFVKLFDFGFQLLVRTQGRAPIKRKLMKPFSKGRYLSKKKRELWIQHFGHD